MGAAKFVLSSAIVGIFWSTFLKGVLVNSTNRCDYSPCSCNPYNKLTCDCKEIGEELILTSEGEKRLSDDTSRIVINNCTSVILMNSSLISMWGLRSFDLENVGNLTLMKQSFELSPATSDVRITVKNTRLEVLPSFLFGGNIETITFDNVRIGRLSTFAFTNLIGTERVTLENCNIETMETQAFKKFDVGHFRVTGGSFGEQVPSRTMNDIEVAQTFILDGIRMGIVRSDAFIVKNSKTVAIQNCKIDTLESQAFNLTVNGPVIIKNNTFDNIAFGGFFGITTEYSFDRPILPSTSISLHDFLFKNNSVKNFEEGSLMFDRNSFRLELDHLLIDRVCDCQQLSIWKNNVLNYTNVYSRLYELQNLPFPSTTATSLSVQEAITETPETFLCLDSQVNGLAITFSDYEARHCTFSDSALVLVLIIIGLLAIFVLIICLGVCCYKRRRKDERKRWISVPTNAPPDVITNKKNGIIGRGAASSNTPVDSRITMVVPDGRLYRETEFHVIVEKAEPLTTEL